MKILPLYKIGTMSCLTPIFQDEIEKFNTIKEKMDKLDKEFEEVSDKTNYQNKELFDLIYDSPISTERENVYLITIDNRSFLCYIEDCDEYRDYANVIELPAIWYKPLPKTVKVQYQLKHGQPIFGNINPQENSLTICNMDGEEIFHCSTDNYDDYYPTGIIRFSAEAMGKV
jgi:hypothetical protein